MPPAERNVAILFGFALLAAVVFLVILWAGRRATDLPEEGTPAYEEALELLAERVRTSGDLEPMTVPDFDRRRSSMQIDEGRQICAVSGAVQRQDATARPRRLVLQGPGDLSGRRVVCCFEGDLPTDLAVGDEIVLRGVAADFFGQRGLHFCVIQAR
ncbi:MAG: hypothetical protein R3F20_05590 [Planctomycetota bacterium]